MTIKPLYVVVIALPSCEYLGLGFCSLVNVTALYICILNVIRLFSIY